MGFDEYNKLDRHPVPYTYSIQKGDQFLYYFGANHSCDPNDPQYSILRTFWAEFLEKTKKQNCVVFVEGGKRKVYNSELEALECGAEANFITYHANKEGIETFSPEPPEKYRFEELLKKFTKEEIIYYEFARMAYQWNRHITKKYTFREYLKRSLARDKENSGWSDFDFSIEHMITLQKQWFDKDFNENDANFFVSVINPTKTTSRINELSRYEDDVFRDAHILKQIEKFWNEGKNLFVVYGESHAVRHERAVKSLIDL